MHLHIGQDYHHVTMTTMRNISKCACCDIFFLILTSLAESRSRKLSLQCIWAIITCWKFTSHAICHAPSAMGYRLWKFDIFFPHPCYSIAWARSLFHIHVVGMVQTPSVLPQHRPLQWPPFSAQGDTQGSAQSSFSLPQTGHAASLAGTI